MSRTVHIPFSQINTVPFCPTLFISCLSVNTLTLLPVIALKFSYSLTAVHLPDLRLNA